MGQEEEEAETGKKRARLGTQMFGPSDGMNRWIDKRTVIEDEGEG